MDILNTIIILFSTLLIPLLLILSFVALKIFVGKSINNPQYPPVKGTVFSLLIHIKDLYDYHAAIAAEHSTYRILAPAQSYIYTTEPRNIEHFLKTSFNKYSKGESSRENMADLFGRGILLADGEEWKHQRKLASSEFSTRILRDFGCSVFRKNAAKLVRVVSQFSDVEGRVFDMQGLLMRCTLDSIFKVGFGVELNCLEGSSEETTEFMKSFDALNALVLWRFLDPLWKLKRFLHIGSEAFLRREAKIVDDFVYQLIWKKRQLLALKGDSNNGKEDILSRFLRESEKDPEKMNDKYLRDIVLNFMIAGKDSTAGTLSWFFYMLCKNPLVQEKVAQEMRDVFGDRFDNSIDDFIENITDANLEQMHYLHAALSETLRLYPAVPVDGKCADVEDTLPDGFRVKKGDEVFYVSYAMGRMPYIWGEDAKDFRPERWLNNGVFQPQSPFKFVAFHAGPRICLGKDFAYRQMKIVSTALLRFYRFKLAEETKDLTYKTLLTLHIDGDLPLCAISRTIF
ncbi:Cytochrome P450 704C1 [Morus notabilis]|uniref:Cytochrome P450 704C1 n=1 Tax=Morus notabilis TaxID=981085 RepID=W9ST88_9ROSA|nr:cytochrome P450 704C1 [Morus notabilis]EXC25396.1 Cytochrome P450 704C1 [Morus notabilis]